MYYFVFNLIFVIQLGVYGTLKLIDSSLPDHSQSTQLLRFTKWHFPRKIPPTGRRAKAKRCYVCSRQGKRRESTYWCEDCSIGLCITPCFENYHTSTYIYQ